MVGLFIVLWFALFTNYSQKVDISQFADEACYDIRKVDIYSLII